MGRKAKSGKPQLETVPNKPIEGDLPNMIDANTAASLIGMSRQFIYRMYSKGLLPGVVIGTCTKRFKKEDVLALARSS